MVGYAPGALPAVVPGQSLAGMLVLARLSQIDVLVVQGSDVNVARSLLATTQEIRYVEADSVAFAQTGPNDPRFAGQYGPRLAGLPAAWSAAGYGSAAVTIAVLDSGIARTHPDLQGARLLAGHDYVNGDAMPNDDCGHGTHVAGIAGASTDNGIGVAGASQATLLPLKVLGSGCSGSLSNIAQAILDATDQGADVITMSFGTTSDSRTLATAVRYAWDHGVLLVAAAGNGAGDDSVRYPAAYNEVIAVSAVDAGKRLASYSSRGAHVEVAAPGTSIDSTTVGGGYGLMSGTSMSAPSVAGILALARSCAPQSTNQGLRDSLATTAEDLGPVGRDASFGFGLARADRLIAAVCGTAPPVVSPTPAPAPAPATGFTAQFTPSSGCNEWWVDVAVTATAPAVAVVAMVNGQATHALPKTAWGTWASSFYVAKGSSVVFQATDAAGDTALSASFPWLGAPPPATGPFTATFSPRSVGNDWWVEAAVTSNGPVAKVEASLDGGAWTTLPKTDWGTYAKSVHAPNGTQVVVRATSSNGSMALSPRITWT